MPSTKPLLYLGKVDAGKMPTDKKKYLAPYHREMPAIGQAKLSFKGAGLSDASWYSFTVIEGTYIQELQRFLNKAGFLPNVTIDGVFGYRTLAGVRLFQEYLRTIEKVAGMEPDGRVGQKTYEQIEQWQKKQATNFVCDWGKPLAKIGNEDYHYWLNLIEKGKQHYLHQYYLNNQSQEKNPILKLREAYKYNSDTRRIQDWDSNPANVHLIGIRRNQQHTFDTSNRNKDLYVLLIKGLVFYFWGSTVPTPKGNKANRSDPPFLLEGQHVYKFSWHRPLGKNKFYQALRSFSDGVLVCRCPPGKDHIDQAHLQPDRCTRNNTINIHWSGIGRSNFSAGCQVIAGASYINSVGQVIDCSSFAASGTAALGTKVKGIRQTYGAYNVLADLIFAYAPPGVQTVTYTLTRDTTAFLADDRITVAKIEALEKSMRDLLPS